MSRDHRSLHSATALLKANDRPIVPGGGGRHRLARVVEVVPPEVDGDTRAMVVKLHLLGAETRYVEDAPDVCPCTNDGGFRVYDGPRDDGRRYEELCRECVTDWVRHCRTDAVVVEVCI